MPWWITSKKTLNENITFILCTIHLFHMYIYICICMYLNIYTLLMELTDFTVFAVCTMKGWICGDFLWYKYMYICMYMFLMCVCVCVGVHMYTSMYVCMPWRINETNFHFIYNNMFIYFNFIYCTITMQS